MVTGSDEGELKRKKEKGKWTRDDKGKRRKQRREGGGGQGRRREGESSIVLVSLSPAGQSG